MRFPGTLIRKLKSESLYGRASRATIWNFVSFGALSIIRLGGNIALANILFPEALGVMALLSAIVIAATLLSDAGIDTALIQNPLATEKSFQNTAWTLRLIRGVLLYLVVLAASPFLAQLYEYPDLPALIAVTGLILIIGPLKPTQVSILKRKLHVGQISRLQLISYATGTACTIFLALWLENVWSLVIGSLFAEALFAVLCFLILKDAGNKLYLSANHASKILHFGKWVFLNTLFTFAVSQSDRMILGVYFDLEVIGFYSIALALGTMPMTVFQACISGVVMPMFREAGETKDENLLHRVELIFFVAKALLISGLLVLSFISGFLTDILYDDRYEGVKVILATLALSEMPAVLTIIYPAKLLAVGDSKTAAKLGGISAISYLTGLLVGLSTGNLINGLLGVFLARLIGFALARAIVPKHVKCKFWMDGVLVLMILGAFAVRQTLITS